MLYYTKLYYPILYYTIPVFTLLLRPALIAEPKDESWREEIYASLRELQEGADCKANPKSQLQELIKKSGIKAIPALQNLVFFDIYQDILLV